MTGHFLVGGIIFSLLMDADHIFHLGQKETARQVRNLRNIFHYPLLYIPTGMIVVSFFSIPWAVLFGLCSLTHFIHDSIGIGWGVQWFYPFSTNHYSFFYLYHPKDKEKLPWKAVYVFKHQDIEALDKKHGDAHWVKNVYLKWHPYAIVEFLVFIVAVIILYFYIQ